MLQMRIGHAHRNDALHPDMCGAAKPLPAYQAADRTPGLGENRTRGGGGGWKEGSQVWRLGFGWYSQLFELHNVHLRFARSSAAPWDPL